MPRQRADPLADESGSGMTDNRDAYAIKLLRGTVRPLAQLVRSFGPDAAIARWRELPPAEQEAAIALLAAGFPVEEPDYDIFGWWTALDRVKPLHADEYVESPRPLLVGGTA
jgi:hypothetical protein